MSKEKAIALIGKGVESELESVADYAYILSRTAVFAEKFNFEDVRQARNYIIEILEDAVADLKSLNERDLVIERMEYLENTVKEYKKDEQERLQNSRGSFDSGI